MENEAETPSTPQITVWRNLLDAFGQLSAAWEAVRDAEAEAVTSLEAEAAMMPGEADVEVAFARAGEQTSEALAGLAGILHNHGRDGNPFGHVASAELAAHQKWAAAHRALSSSSEPA